MPKVSVVIPTHNRPEMLKRSIASVIAQTYTDWELIVVDDGLKERVRSVVESFNDERIKYIAHEKERGGSAARNTGIQASSGDYIAFLDDDDEWLSGKLGIQIKQMETAAHDVGFCFSAVTDVYNDHEENSTVPEGVRNYLETALGNTKGFLTVTLVVRRNAFEASGMFDENFPSHQEPDLVIRLAKRFKGLGVNQPLVRVNMKSGYERVGSNIHRRITGREMLLKKHWGDFAVHPDLVAFHLFQLGLFYRTAKQYHKARRKSLLAFHFKKKARYLLHATSMLGDGWMYRLIRSNEQRRERDSSYLGTY